MIVPERTYWPSPRLTPSRCPALSRPFLLDEPAFLCAMCYSSAVAVSAFLAGLRRHVAGLAAASDSALSALAPAFGLAAGLRVLAGFAAASFVAEAFASGSSAASALRDFFAPVLISSIRTRVRC